VHGTAPDDDDYMCVRLRDHVDLERTNEALFRSLVSWRRYAGDRGEALQSLDPTTRAALERWRNMFGRDDTRLANALATSSLSRRLMRRDRYV
jgi:hypothetical protein